jgi:hypothetical protein
MLSFAGVGVTGLVFAEVNRRAAKALRKKINVVKSRETPEARCR